jgi:acyl-coenzyme A thioesterase PaaI-like protein
MTSQYPDAPPPGTVIPTHFAGCFVCGGGEGGLRMRMAVGEGARVLGEYDVPVHHQGAPGIAHGGVIAAAFDETLGMLQVFTGELAVTGRLTTTFRRPVPVGTLLCVEARLDGREGRKVWTSGTARLGGADGPVAATAEALFVVVSPEHFARYERVAAEGAE